MPFLYQLTCPLADLKAVKKVAGISAPLETATDTGQHGSTTGFCRIDGPDSGGCPHSPYVH